MKEVIEENWLFCWSFDSESDQKKFNSDLLGLLIWFSTLNCEILLLGQTVWNIFDIFFQNICLEHYLIRNYSNSSVNKLCKSRLLAFLVQIRQNIKMCWGRGSIQVGRCQYIVIAPKVKNVTDAQETQV